MKAAPFKRRVEETLEAARAKGFKEVTITTADGAAYKFRTDERAEAEVPAAEVDDNEIRDRASKWKANRNDRKTQKPQER